LMPAVATRLSDAEIDAVSAYYANLPKQAAAPRPEAAK
ncbi:c-type cytochrome, partial [Bordetella pertussis]